jgi:hypothetical protein
MRMVGTAHVVTERNTGTPEEVASETLIDDSHPLRGRSVGSGEVAASEERNSQCLKILVTYPGKLNIEVFVWFTRIAADEDVAQSVIVRKVGIVSSR